MDSSWKRIIYLICTIQVGGGITIIGVLSFLPLFLAELGLHDPGEAAMWAGLVSGVTPCMVALSAPYWSRKANQLGHVSYTHLDVYKRQGLLIVCILIANKC